MATTTTINHSSTDLSHQTVTLHHLGSLAHLKADGNLYAYAVSGDNSNDLILYANSAQPQAIDFLLDGNNGNGVGSSSSHESMANLLDEGLGTSLDGTDEISTISSAHSLIGRNDSGVFTGDEVGAVGVQQDAVHQEESTSSQSLSLSDVTASVTGGHATTPMLTESETDSYTPKNKQWPKSLSPNRQGPQRCAVCGKTFSNASALTKHKLTHSDERKHACSMCGKAFKRQDHLNGHMLTHRNKKPFECAVKGCGKSYCDARSLRRHIESRHGHSVASTTTRLTMDHSPTSTEIGNKLEARVVKSKRKSKSSSIDPLVHPGNKTFPGADLPESFKSSLPLESPTKIISDFLPNVAQGSESDRLLPVGSKYVMVKLKDKLMMTTPAVAGGCVVGDSPESLLLQNNNNNILMTPETIATILSNAIVQETTKLTNDLLKVSIPTNPNGTTSQLHQLLTQRPSTSETVSMSLPISNSAGASAKGQPMEFGAKWDGNENEQLADFVSDGNSRQDSSDRLEIGKCGSSNTDGGTSSSSANGTTQLPTSSSTKSHPPALISSGGKSGGGGRGSGSGGLSTTSPALLKEQLELIHHIIQQAQEECVNNSTLPKSKTFKGKTKGTKSPSTSQSKSSPETFEDLSKFGTVDDKPVECTICFRRFKNTPALNGHMRLHGGYFKGGKDPDGKRKDSTGNKDLNATLQTASVSVRALIEEKIIQKRNTSSQSSKGTDSGVQKAPVLLDTSSTPSPILSISSSSPNTGIIRTTGSTSGSNVPGTESTSTSVPISPSGVTTFQSSSANVTLTSQEPHSGLDEEPDETFGFIYSQEDQDNSEYLLKDLEEEVFNKVSSICPESFLDGIIDESILSGGNNGSEDLMPTEWSWSSSSSTSNGGNGRLHSLYSTTTTGTSSTSTDDSPLPLYHFTKMEGNEQDAHTPPMPPLDPNVFYMSPTPQSPSIKSQDSPSFPYPTPPASLESHPALQSPLFSFGGSSSIGTTTFYGFEHMTCDPVTINMMEMSGGGPGSDGDSKLFSSDSPSVDEIVLRLGKAIKQEVGTLISMTPESEPIQDDVKIKIEPVDASGVVSFGSSEVTKFLTPSSSPKRFAGPESPQSVPSGSVLNESKVNEALQPLGSFGSSLDSRLDGFLNPNRVATNTHSYVKSGKRKQVRNTFASNLRQNPSSQSQVPHFTPYPILSPVRSAPGLYWTFSQKLSHVEDSVRECPRINVGPTFQATNLPEPFSRPRKRKASSVPDPQSDPEVEILEVIESNDGNAPLWDPNAMQHCSTDEVEKYLEFACCSAVPGGGRNKEYALHLLNHFKGDINAAILLLMNPQPQVPTALRTYGYSDNAKWTPSELIVFKESLLKYGKNFGTLAAQIPTKSRADCISFYHLWKKICPNEYERIRTTWKKREAAFTLDLLKSVPPTTPGALAALAHAQHDQPSEPIALDSPENPHQQKKLGVQEIRTVNNGQIDFVNGLSFQSHEDYPCKICGKVFTKVKSRSAHMKSHRPPDQQQSDQQGMNHFQKKSKPSFTIPLETSTSMRMSSKSSGPAAVSRNNTIPPPLLEVPDTRLTSIKDKVT